MILKTLKTQNAVNSTFCISLGQIKKTLDKARVVSEKTLRRYIKALINKNYLKEGEKDGKFKRYYLTEEAIQTLSQLNDSKSN